MPYTADINRANPGCFLFLVDQSGSMGGQIGGQKGRNKAEHAADAINRIVDTLAQRCSQGMEVRDYFHIGILGYTSEGWFSNSNTPAITSAIGGTTPERPFLPMSQLVETAEIVERQVRENHGGEIVEMTRRMPVWLRPHVGKQDPLGGTLRLVESPLSDWVDQHPDSYPPIVIIVCDGSSTDGNPEPMARRIKDLRTNDGNVLLFTVHLSESSVNPTMFPSDDRGLPSQSMNDGKMMFRLASELPEPIRRQATSLGIPVDENSRGLVFNADAVALAQFLDIGTRGPSNLH